MLSVSGVPWVIERGFDSVEEVVEVEVEAEEEEVEEEE